MHEPDDHAPSGNQGYEPTDIQLRIIAYSGVAVVLMTLIAYIFSTFVVRFVNAQPPISEFEPTPMAIEGRSQPFASGVRLQVAAPEAMQGFRAEQYEAATTFGVVSDEPEIFRIPVDTAMDIVAERGLPEFSKVITAETPEQQ